MCRRPDLVEGTLAVSLLYAPQALFVLLAAMALVVAVYRRHLLGCLLAAPALILVALGLGSFQPRLPGPAGGDLQVATLNSDSWFTSPYRLAEFVRTVPADVLLLQEIWSDEAYAGCVAANPRLFWYRQADGEGRELALGSRFPGRVVELPARLTTLLAVELDLGGRKLIVVNLHLRKSPVRRLGIPAFRGTDVFQRAEIEEWLPSLRALQRSTGDDVLIGGDFNCTPNTPIFHELSSSFVDCLGTVGSGFNYTFPWWLPVWRIDEFLVSGDLHPVSCRALEAVGSDHRPVWLQLGFGKGT